MDLQNFPGGLRGPTLHQRNKFEDKWPLRDCFIDNLAASFPSFSAAKYQHACSQMVWAELHHIWGGHGPIIIATSKKFQIPYSVSKRGRLKSDWGRKWRPNVALFDPRKFGEGRTRCLSGRRN